MKGKIFIVIASLIGVIAVISYFIDGPKTVVIDGHTYTYEYSFMSSLNVSQYNQFPDILKLFRQLFANISKIGDWGSYDLEWYEYVPLFFSWLGKILMFPVDLIKAIFQALMAILNVIIDFFSCWKRVEVI